MAADQDPHAGFRYFGPKQGAQCRCGAWFYPLTGRRDDQDTEHRRHVRQVQQQDAAAPPVPARGPGPSGMEWPPPR